MTLDYRDFIVSTEENCTFLHRTTRNLVDKAMQIGFICCDIQSTTTRQPRELDSAIGLYENGKCHGDCAVVVRIPRKVFERAHREGFLAQEALHPEIGYLNPDINDFAIQPKYMHAWIDRKDNSVHLNPNLFGGEE